MANLGQRLLSAFTATMFVGFALVMLRDATSIGTAWLAWRGLVLVVMAVATALTVTRTRWRLRQLRVIEAVAFATVTLYLAATTYAVGVADLATGAAAWTGTLLGFGLLMIAYGVFVVNTLARAVVGVVVIGAAPLAAVLLVRTRAANAGAAFDAVATGRLFETGLVLGGSAAVAVFSAFVTYTLFTYAYDQRKRTYYDLEERIGSGGMDI